MFAYCLNNPINYLDNNGESAFFASLGIMAVGGLINGIANAIATARNGGSFSECAWAGLAGFLGGMAGTGLGILMSKVPAIAQVSAVVGRGVSTFLTDVFTSLFINGTVSQEELLLFGFDAVADMTLSTIGYYYLPLPDSTDMTKTVVYGICDGLTDIGQNELFHPNSTTNRNSYNTADSFLRTIPREYAMTKVGKLIGAI
jgi:hypothetical protein